MNGETQLIAVIVALWTVLTGLVGAIIKYLVNENTTLKKAIETGNAATAASNSTNAKLVELLPGVLAENQQLRQSPPTSTPVAESRP